jgi:hypothetical protein
MLALNTLAYYTTFVLALTHMISAVAGPTRTTKRDIKRSVQAAPKGSAAAARLHQTSWRQIQARNALRMSPMYRRQQGSALPALTCPETFNSELGVARYPNIDILGGDVSEASNEINHEAYASCPTQQWPVPGPISVETENDCLSVCQGRPGYVRIIVFFISFLPDVSSSCIGYFWWDARQECYPKVRLHARRLNSVA